MAQILLFLHSTAIRSIPLYELDDIANNPLEEEKEADVGTGIPLDYRTPKGFPQVEGELWGYHLIIEAVYHEHPLHPIPSGQPGWIDDGPYLTHLFPGDTRPLNLLLDVPRGNALPYNTRAISPSKQRDPEIQILQAHDYVGDHATKANP